MNDSALQRAAVRYWGRKIGKVLDVVISILRKQYGSSKLVVVDPFGGAGTIVQKLLRIGHKVIYSDPNLYAWLITKYHIGRCKSNKVSFQNVLPEETKALDPHGKIKRIKLQKLYVIWCPYCKIFREVIRYYWENCMCIARLVCGHNVECDDVELEPYYLYPMYELKYPDGKWFYKRRNVRRIDELYTRRALLVLTAILNKVKKYSIKGYAGTLYWLALMAIQYNSSKMAREGCGAWAINSYWIPPKHVELNPLKLYINRLKLLMKVKTLSINTTTSLRKTEKIRYEPSLDAAILRLTATQLAKSFNKPIADVIVTDPPHADETQYFELSFLHNSWYCVHQNPVQWQKCTELQWYKEEIVVNPQQGKGIKEYLELLGQAFASFRNMLKPNGMLIVMLHEENIKLLQKMIDTIISQGYRQLDTITLNAMNVKPIGAKGKNNTTITIIIARKI